MPSLLASVGDPGRTRAVIVSIALLIALGVGLVLLAMWLLRTTRSDPEVLAPLEVMGQRSWLKREPEERRQLLDEARPEGAVPLDPAAAEAAHRLEEVAAAEAALAELDELLIAAHIDVAVVEPEPESEREPGPEPEPAAPLDAVTRDDSSVGRSEEAAVDDGEPDADESVDVAVATAEREDLAAGESDAAADVGDSNVEAVTTTSDAAVEDARVDENDENDVPSRSDAHDPRASQAPPDDDAPRDDAGAETAAVDPLEAESEHA